MGTRCGSPVTVSLTAPASDPSQLPLLPPLPGEPAGFGVFPAKFLIKRDIGSWPATVLLGDGLVPGPDFLACHRDRVGMFSV